MIDVFGKLCDALGPETVKAEEPMRHHTTFRIGGPAEIFAEPESTKALAEAVTICRQAGKPFYLLGNGSNLLVSDDGWRGVVISTGRLKDCQIMGPQDSGEEGPRDVFLLRAESGVLLSKLAKVALEHCLTGLEFAAGIPGTLGGALVMNAGAYGSEMKDVVAYAELLTSEGEIRTVTVEELNLGYRTSCIPGRGCVVLAVTLRLEKGDPETIRLRMEELAFQRKSKQPLEYPSAGSTFKRPAGYFAGKLIDDAGLRGFSVGGAQVSEKHCGFVINKGDATAEDVLKLCALVSARVKEQFGVELEMEVKRLS